MPMVGVPIAAAICIRPESLEIATSAAAIASTPLRRSAPVRSRARPPVVPDDADRLVAPYADPVPQALVLTAIVIGFGLLAFSLVLADRVHDTTGTDDVDEVGRER